MTTLEPFDSSGRPVIVSDPEILTRAIEKAVAGGLNESYGQVALHMLIEAYSTNVEAAGMFVRGIIFNHAFAKALWGEKETDTGDAWYDPEGSANGTGAYVSVKLPAWQYHLQQMVIALDLIKYLGEHI